MGIGFSIALGAAAAGFIVVPKMILNAPVEPVMGFVQKIFYFHVPCAIMLFLSTFACAGGSIAFLFKGSERGDWLAASQVATKTHRTPRTTAETFPRRRIRKNTGKKTTWLRKSFQ